MFARAITQVNDRAEEKTPALNYMNHTLSTLTFALAANFAVVMQAAAQTPTPTPTPVPDESVAWQNNALHDGNNPSSPVVPPLALKWRHNFAAVV